jgi:hypothetical protein
MRALISECGGGSKADAAARASYQRAAAIKAKGRGAGQIHGGNS